jgi:hypothetical protein
MSDDSAATAEDFRLLSEEPPASSDVAAIVDLWLEKAREQAEKGLTKVWLGNQDATKAVIAAQRDLCMRGFRFEIIKSKSQFFGTSLVMKW